MTAIQVFDPAMCCSTGVCGPAVDPNLVRLSADLDWLMEHGITVERFNLAQQPAAFAADADVRRELEARGESALPLIKVNGTVQSVGAYPTRAVLANWTGVAAPAPSIFTESVAELVAIGAAIASNCESCFKYHYDRARKLGVSREDMRQAVSVAEGVKGAPAKSVLELAHRILKAEGATTTTTPATKGGSLTVLTVASVEANACCTPPGAGALGDKSSRCC